MWNLWNLEKDLVLTGTGSNLGQEWEGFVWFTHVNVREFRRCNFLSSILFMKNVDWLLLRDGFIECYSQCCLMWSCEFGVLLRYTSLYQTGSTTENKADQHQYDLCKQVQMFTGGGNSGTPEGAFFHTSTQSCKWNCEHNHEGLHLKMFPSVCVAQSSSRVPAWASL